MKRALILFAVILLVCALGAPVFASDGESGGENIGIMILIGCIGGAVAAVSTAIGVVCSYKRKSRSAQYPLDRYASMKLTSRADIFLSRHVTRTKISSSSKKR